MNPAVQAMLDLLAAAPVVTGSSTSPAGAPAGPPAGTPAGGPGTPGAPSIAHQEQQHILNLVGLEVIGYYHNGSIDVYSLHNRRLHSIPDFSRLQYARLVQIAGVAALNNIHGGRDLVAGRRNMDEMRNALGYFAQFTPLHNITMLGQGIWRADNQIVILNGSEVRIYDPVTGDLMPATPPRVGNQYLDMSEAEPWCDFSHLTGLCQAARSANWCADVFRRASGLFRLWQWKRPIDASVATALAVCTWVQTLLAWRPEVMVTGRAAAGKSTLYKTLLAPLFGPMALYSDQSTEAGIRQGMGTRSVALILDEFEKSRARPQILTLFRSTGTGAEIRRGTADQKGIRFWMRHLPWMSAIESGLHDEADRNRFIILDLERPTPGKRLVMPLAEDITRLGLELLAVGLRYVEPAVALHRRLKTHQVGNVGGRVIDNFAVPVAMWAAIEHQDEAQAIALLEQVMANRDHESQLYADEAALIEDIMSSTIDIGGGHKITVGDALSNASSFRDNQKHLERCGITISQPDTRGRYSRTWGRSAKHFVVFYPRSIRRFLLRGTHWADMDIGQLLKRCDGVQRHKVTVASRKVDCILLPTLTFIDPLDGQHNDELLDQLDFNTLMGEQDDPASDTILHDDTETVTIEPTIPPDEEPLPD